MPAKHTRDAQLALLLPMALSQGWGVKEFATKAGIATQAACDLLRKAAKQAEVAISQVESVDALALTIPYGEGRVSLGKLQGELVAGAVEALAETPPNPRDWTRKDQDGYNNAQRILRDAKALGLIRFGESDKAGNPPAMRHVDPFAAQDRPSKQGKSDKSPTESASVNDGALSSGGGGADNPPVQGEGEE